MRRKRYGYDICSSYTGFDYNEEQLIQLPTDLYLKYEQKFADDIVALFIASGCQYVTIGLPEIHINMIRKLMKVDTRGPMPASILEKVLKLEDEDRLSMEDFRIYLKYYIRGYISFFAYNKSHLSQLFLTEPIPFSAFFESPLSPEKLNQIISNQHLSIIFEN